MLKNYGEKKNQVYKEKNLVGISKQHCSHLATREK